MKKELLAPDPDAQICPVTNCLSVIGGKWKPVIIFCIANGVDRFGVMQRAILGITKQMLTKQLRELEADGIISRKVFAEVPPRVDYALTQKGRSVLPIIEHMEAWGQEHMA
ncbi:helix-turn-helix domain-containing protein [Yoonia sp. GPGPB17]|uniref:winged helix-turn-helix transcriptional regulator n=1 Tax=Yoonia sp. GPGPB17 TaxID=3026147 RepID=UPI0030C2B41F